MLKQLNTELSQLLNDAKALRLSMDEKFTKAGNKDYEGISDDRQKLENFTARGEEIHKQIKAIRESMDLIGDPEPEPEPSLAPVKTQGRKSVGQQVIESKQFEYAGKSGAHLERVEVKTIEEGVPASGGFLVFSDRDERLRELPQQPFSVIDYILTLPTNSNSVEIIQEKTNVNNAAVVPEKGLKPESNLTFDRIIVPIVTIATWIGATRQILSDAPRMRAYIDNRLRIFVRRKLESEVISGTGGATSLSGLLSVAGTQQRVHGTASNSLGGATDTFLDTLRHAITDLELKFMRPSIMFFNPRLSDRLEVLKDTTGQYLLRYDPVTSRVWRVPAVSTAAIPDGTTLLMDREMSAELYMREEVSIYTGQPFVAAGADATAGKDYFLHNMFAILAELRAGLAVPYPDGIVEVTGLVTS
jgi:HK97 family phage major capsid protein